MANTYDPTDHFRTTHQHAGESFIDIYCWPGLLSIVVGAMSLIGCVAAAAYDRAEWVPTTGIVGVLAVAGGIAWLVVEHRRVLRIERLWLAEHPIVLADQPTLQQRYDGLPQNDGVDRPRNDCVRP